MDGELDEGDVESSSPDGERVRVRRTEPQLCPVCGVKLSAYNPGPNCWQHTIGHPWRGPSAKPRY
jgi:hypothetical protein